MIEISLCMIVKNESENLKRCLDSVKKAIDEIIIVDTGSSDNTKEIANFFTNKIYYFEWIDDFSAARNFSFSKATKEYIMWLDADDVVTFQNLQKLIKLKTELPDEISNVYMRYNVSFDENEKPTFFYFRERLIKRKANPIWVEPVHEVIISNGKNYYSDIEINHKKVQKNSQERNLKILEKHIKNGLLLSPRLEYYYGRELFENGKINEAISVLEKFLNDEKGWIENNIEACRCLAECYLRLNKENEAINILLSSFRYDIPRGENLCKLGEIFFNKKNYHYAIYWFKLALNSKPNDNCLGFIENDYYGFIPAISICVCYDKLGNKEKAQEYNEIAGKFRPKNAAYLYNKNYFEKLNN